MFYVNITLYMQQLLLDGGDQCSLSVHISIIRTDLIGGNVIIHGSLLCNDINTAAASNTEYEHALSYRLYAIIWISWEPHR